MKKMMRRMLSLTMAVMLLLSATVGALAASYDASDYAGLETAFADTTGEDVSVNVTADITFEGSLTAREGINYTIGSNNGSTLTDASFFGTGSVEINDMDLTGVTGLIANGGVEVTVIDGNVTGDWGGVYAYENSTVNVTGNVTSENGAGIHAENSTVNVTGNVTGAWNGISADDSTVTVKGDITGGGDGIFADNSSTVNVTGNVTGDECGVYADGSTVTVTGNVTGAYDGINAYDSTVSIDGNVAGLDGNPEKVDFSDPWDGSDGGSGITADGSTVNVSKNVTGGNGYGTMGNGGHAIHVLDSQVCVGGSVIGGNVTADPNTVGAKSRSGHGVYASGNSKVSVKGNVTGGSTNGDSGIGGDGVYIYRYDDDNMTAVTVGGMASCGSAENGKDGFGIGVLMNSSSCETFNADVTVGGYDSVGSHYGFTDEELAEFVTGIKVTGIPCDDAPVVNMEQGELAQDTFWSDVIKQIRSAEKGTTLTVDADDRTTMPAGVVEAVKECGVTLIIQWEGGKDITIDANFNKEATNGIYLLADL